MNNENKENMVKSEEIKNKLLEISEDIKGLKFKTRLVGGVDTLDVWRKLSQIDKKYQEMLEIQKEFYENKLLELENEVLDLKSKINNVKDNVKDNEKAEGC